MKKLEIKRADLEISGSFDECGECSVWAFGFTYINKDEMQLIIDHLTLLLKQ